MLNIFLSRPTRIAPEFEKGLEGFLTLLKTLDVQPRTLGTTDYPSKCPLDEVITLMAQCRGAIILGYPQITIVDGTIKNSKIKEPIHLPTEWNHIETGLAYARDLPLLVIHHKGIGRGVFDRGALSSFLHQVDFSDWKENVVEMKSSQNHHQESIESSIRIPLSTDMLEVLQQFIAPGAGSITVTAIASNLKIAHQKVQYYIDQLLHAGYVARTTNSVGSIMFKLSSSGRAYLVEHGLL
jgi:predicted transcriptional regulator